MKKLEITLTKSDIMAEVSLATAYAGIKSIATDSATFDRIAAVDSDAGIIHRFWMEMCGLVTEKLRDFVAESSQTEKEFSITMRLSEAYDESMNRSVESDIFSGFTAGVIARWFRFSLPERAKEWEEESLSLLDRAYRKLYQRVPPRRMHNSVHSA